MYFTESKLMAVRQASAFAICAWRPSFQKLQKSLQGSIVERKRNFQNAPYATKKKHRNNDMDRETYTFNWLTLWTGKQKK
jgi:hypothetical protein